MVEDLISVIVPVYNVEKYLNQCLDSIINQTYKNLEIIVVDDGSTDNSGKICDEYAQKDCRIKVIHQRNADLSTARNSGLKIATGKYIGYIDSDDYIELDTYEKLYNMIQKTKSDLSISNRYFGKKDGTWMKNVNFPDKTIITGDEALKYFYNSMFVRNKLYNADIIKNLEFVETYAQDVIYNFAVFQKVKKIACLDECKIYYRYNYKSRQHTKKFRKDRYIYLNEGINKEIYYAHKKGLYSLEKDLINARSRIILKWLWYLALDDKPDTDDINQLSKIIKDNLWLFLKSDGKIIMKLFAICVCLSFRVTSILAKFLRK